MVAYPYPVSRLIDALHSETEAFHAEADHEAIQLLGPVAPADYWRYLTRCYGIVRPIERAIVRVGEVSQYVDARRFRKHDLLRRDLEAFGMTAEQIEALPQCAMPLFDTVEEALGWAYIVERSTLGHNNLFHHLATMIPGDVAFTSSYLKCYFGAAGEMWRAFGLALERIAEDPARAARTIEAAKTAFRTYRSWRRHEERDQSSSESGAQQFG